MLHNLNVLLDIAAKRRSNWLQLLSNMISGDKEPEVVGERYTKGNDSHAQNAIITLLMRWCVMARDEVIPGRTMHLLHASVTCAMEKQQTSQVTHFIVQT